jgi:hypothetical protein
MPSDKFRENCGYDGRGEIDAVGHDSSGSQPSPSKDCTRNNMRPYLEVSRAEIRLNTPLIVPLHSTRRPEPQRARSSRRRHCPSRSKYASPKTRLRSSRKGRAREQEWSALSTASQLWFFRKLDYPLINVRTRSYNRYEFASLGAS